MRDNEPDRVSDLISQLQRLTKSQLGWIQSVIDQFQLPFTYNRNVASDLITDEVLERMGDALRIHHAFSRQALSKDRFEYAFERSLNLSGIQAALARSRTNRGHDITIRGVPVSLKTEAAKNISKDSIHVSKWMELGRGEWQLDCLLKLFLEHMNNYERIFTFRQLQAGPIHFEYELVEIPKSLLLESERAELVVQETSRQAPKPGYGYVRDEMRNLRYALYFDGGTERKLQIKHLQKTLCIVHATWGFSSASLS